MMVRLSVVVVFFPGPLTRAWNSRGPAAGLTRLVIGGVVFLWGRGGLPAGAARAVAAVALAVQAESEEAREMVSNKKNHSGFLGNTVEPTGSPGWGGWS